MLVSADRVKDSTSTTGTGSVTLTGTPPTGYRSFSSVMATNDTCYYCIVAGSEWEVGLGTLTASTTLARTAVLTSSNANALVSFSAGAKDVFITVPAALTQNLGYQTQWNALYPYPWGTLTSADEFDAGTLSGSWTKIDPSGTSAYVTWTQANGALVANHTTGSDPSSGLHCLLMPVGTAFATGDALVTAIRVAAPAGNYTMVGLCVTTGTVYGTSNLVETEIYVQGSSCILRAHTEPGINSDGSQGGVTLAFPNALLWLRLVMTSATTWRSDYSADGINWLTQGSVTYTLTPTYMGLNVSNWSTATPSVTTFEFFRRYSGVS